jgi:hypothetical protein
VGSGSPNAGWERAGTITRIRTFRETGTNGASTALFSFSETFVIDPTGEIGENIIVDELRALRRKRPALFYWRRRGAWNPRVTA